MQTDGNLVLYDTSGQPHWDSNTAGKTRAFLNVQDDGNLVVYLWESLPDDAIWESGTSVPPPLSLSAVIDSGAMLNVGDANLSNLSYNMLFNPAVGAGGGFASYPEQGFWSSQPGPGGCPGNTVTVNAQIEANWHNGGPGWTWQGLRDAFATALGAAMQAASNPTEYQNYSYTEIPEINSFGAGGVICTDPQPLDKGYCIPAAIQITAYDNISAQVGQVTVTYSTQDQEGGSVCDAISGIVSSGLPLVLDDTAAAVVATIMTVICALVDG